MCRPSSTLRSSNLSFWITSMTASAAAQLTGLPEYVPPSPPTGTESITSARPITAASGKPPARLFADAIRSGITPLCSIAKKRPVRPNPD